MLSGSGIHVLVVDDEQFILDSLTGFLEDFEFTVFYAGSAEAAFSILKENPVQVVIVDLRLPGMSGDVLIRKIHSQLPHIRFIIHTGSVGYVLPEDLKSIGMKAEHVFFKPVPDLTVLLETVFSFVNRKPDE